jgi:hypothetical protein
MRLTRYLMKTVLQYRWENHPRILLPVLLVIGLSAWAVGGDLVSEPALQ